MNNQVIFMPLGGGQRVGASCYYLQLGNYRIILDAGTGIINGVVYNPILSQLLTSADVHSLSQINQIFISHAHLDHTGYLNELSSQCRNASVYMTEITRALNELQNYDRMYLKADSGLSEVKRLEAQMNLDRITVVNYMQSIKFPGYKVTFLPAGHIPGAMMILFEYGKRKILYTGDYSVDPTPMCSSCFVPENQNIDTVIMCGLHAKHPYYRKKSEGLYNQVDYILNSVKEGKSIQCTTSQLSKGIEFLKLLNEKNSGKTPVPVYIDKSVMQVVEKLEKLGIKTFDSSNRIMQNRIPEVPHIYLTSDSRRCNLGYQNKLEIDFTLHEDFTQMRKFIELVKPKQVIAVHCASANNDSYTIEQEILLNSGCNTQFIFAEDQEIYQL